MGRWLKQSQELVARERDAMANPSRPVLYTESIRMHKHTADTYVGACPWCHSEGLQVGDEWGEVPREVQIPDRG